MANGSRKAEILDREPPSDVEAERFVVGSMILLPDACFDVAPLLVADDFHDSRNAEIFRLVIGRWNEQKRVDVKLVYAAAKKAGTFDDIGGASYLAEVLQGIPSAGNAAYYARIVRDASLRRSLLRVGSELLRLGYEPREDLGDLLDSAERQVMAVRERSLASGGEVATIGEVLLGVMSELADRETGQIRRGLTCGLDDLDGMVEWRPGDLVILAARTSVGKSALAANVACHVAAQPGWSVLYVTLEMKAAQLSERMLSAMAGVSFYNMRQGRLVKSERERLVEAAAVLSGLRLTLDDAYDRNAAQIAAVARRHKRRSGLSLLVVDYVQLIEPENRRESREQQVAAITRRLKMLAAELGIVVLCLAQLNREADKGGSRPRLSHLRESGAIEQDADVVLFIHRPECEEVDPERKRNLAGQAAVIVAKNRNGKTGDCRVLWDGDTMTFKPASAGWAPGELFE